jgi:hypothetical protein
LPPPACPCLLRPACPCLQACSDASVIIPLGLAAPYAWRLVQCIRVYLDTGARPQLFNAIKYSTAFPVGGRVGGWVGGQVVAVAEMEAVVVGGQCGRCRMHMA